MSRVLPVVPNLEHLRKQAKALLRDLRQRCPNAKLSAAQQEMALQYGFKNWPALKASVESAQPYLEAPSVTGKRGKQDFRIHIAPDDSAAGCCTRLGWMSPANLAVHPEPAALSRETIAELNLAWAAIVAPEPTPLLDFIGQASGHAPFLRPALRALIERYPDRKSGLSRADLTLLKKLTLKPTRNGCIGAIGETLGTGANFRDVWSDSWLWERMQRMADASLPQPALTLSVEGHETADRRRRKLAAKADGLKEIDPDDAAYARFLLQSDIDRRTTFELTGHGVAIVQGKASFLEANGIDDWVLGVHLDSRRGRVWYRRAGKPYLTRARQN